MSSKSIEASVKLKNVHVWVRSWRIRTADAHLGIGLHSGLGLGVQGLGFRALRPEV